MIVILIDVVGPAGHVADIISEMIPSMENCMLQLFYFLFLFFVLRRASYNLQINE